MFGESIFNNAIIEVEKDTTDEELEEIRKCYPASKIFREDDEELNKEEIK